MSIPSVKSQRDFFLQRYGRTPSKELIMEAGEACPICQESMEDPIELNQCKVRKTGDLMRI